MINQLFIYQLCDSSNVNVKTQIHFPILPVERNRLCTPAMMTRIDRNGFGRLLTLSQ